MVPVVLVPVASVQRRLVIEPVAALTPPLTAMEDAFTFAKFAVPLTLRLDEVTPPKKVTATEVVAPRPVTVAKVSASAPAGGQFVPSDKQTSKPLTTT